jgi:hypothetical protein
MYSDPVAGGTSSCDLSMIQAALSPYLFNPEREERRPMPEQIL